MNEDKKVEKKDKMQELEEQAAMNLLGWQKALADYQNLHKETEQKLSSLKNFVINDFIQEILPIFDNYQTAISHIPPAEKDQSWAIGLEHIYKMWESFLNNHDIIKISTVGELFDPHRHEAIGHLKDETKKDQEVVEEKQAGFVSGEQIIRPAKVIINQLT